MTIWGFLIGLIIGFFPLLLILKFFKGKFLFIANTYVKGALFGFLLWGVINGLFYLEARYSIFGLVNSEEGFNTMILFTTAMQGFITAGLLAAVITNKLWKRKRGE